MDSSIENLVNIVTQRVMEVIAQQERPTLPSADKAIVIGCTADVPQSLSNGFQLCAAGDCCIDECKRVIITRITTSQLADAAAGRAVCPETATICGAILRGIEVYMLDGAPEHRRFAKTCNKGFYNMLEGYVATLKGFGVKSVSGTEKAPEMPHCTVQRSGGDVTLPKVITEKDAKRLCMGRTELTVCYNTIITPSAKDIFLHAGVTIKREDEQS